jgi:hypothetical protein
MAPGSPDGCGDFQYSVVEAVDPDAVAIDPKYI